MLQAQLSEGTSLPSYLESIIQTFTKDVMGRPEQGDTVVMQIIKQIGSSPLQARSGSRLDQVVTASHELADRNTLIHRERLLLYEVSTPEISHLCLYLSSSCALCNCIYQSALATYALNNL